MLSSFLKEKNMLQYELYKEKSSPMWDCPGIFCTFSNMLSPRNHHLVCLVQPGPVVGPLEPIELAVASTFPPGGPLQSSLLTPWCGHLVHRSQLSADRSAAQQQITVRKTHVCVSTSLTSFFFFFLLNIFVRNRSITVNQTCWSPTFLSSEHNSLYCSQYCAGQTILSE